MLGTGDRNMTKGRVDGKTEESAGKEMGSRSKLMKSFVGTLCVLLVRRHRQGREAVRPNSDSELAACAPTNLMIHK